MDGARQRPAGGRRRRKSRGKKSGGQTSDPVLIVARRPDSPRVRTPSKNIAASAKPRKNRRSDTPTAYAPSVDAPSDEAATVQSEAAVLERPRRAARIIAAPTAGHVDDAELVRARLMQRFLEADGRGAITRAANALAEQQIAIPEEQEHQVQLLEHTNEERVRDAMEAISRLLQRQPPRKRPILERRLRRLEQEADDPETRECAAALRRAMRVADTG